MERYFNTKESTIFFEELFPFDTILLRVELKTKFYFIDELKSKKGNVGKDRLLFTNVNAADLFLFFIFIVPFIRFSRELNKKVLTKKTRRWNCY